MDRQQFSLSWKNFHGNLSDGFSGLLGSGEFVDVTLAVDGQLLQAHKVVLSICSPYFKRMFQINPCQHPIVVLRDITHRAMKDLLQFMYNGEVSVMQEDLSNFISTAETLEIKGLTNKHSEEDTASDLTTKPSSPLVTANHTTNHLHSTQPETCPEAVDLYTEDVEQCLNSHTQKMEIIGRLNRLAAFKRKSQDFTPNAYPLDGKEHPEKRTKILREKQILNRHKITRTGGITVKNFETVNSPVNNMMNEAMLNAAILHSNSFALANERRFSEEGKRTAPLLNDIKRENGEGNNGFDEAVGGREADSGDSIRSLESQVTMPTSPKREQDGALSLVLDGREPPGTPPALRYRYIYSRKGHKQLVHANFVYTKHSTSHGKTSWRCVQYFSLNRCPATVETVGALIYAVNHVHNHEDSSDKIINNSVYEMDDDKQ